MKNIFKSLSVSMATMLGISSCANSQTLKPEPINMEGKKVLVAYFSRAGENYNVGHIKEGNTEVIAKMINDKVGGDLFHIETMKPYPVDYNDCIEQAKKEKEANARPEIKGDVKVEDYDVIFIGTPNWWGEAPMALYTFIEKHNWQGKTIIPFATHEGSGMSGMDQHILKVCKGATMHDGFTIYGHEAQDKRDLARQKVEKWLENFKF